MAIQQAVASAQISDGRSEVTSHEQAITYDDAVTTLANLIAWVQGWAVQLDTVTDGKIVKLRLSLLIPLPTGLKANAVAGSDNEKTGLSTLVVVGSVNAFGVDVPAIPNALLVGNQIDQTNANYTAWKSYITATTTGIKGTDRYGNQLTSAAKHAVLTFRKHRRALRRA